jgi:hypothetical protein
MARDSEHSELEVISFTYDLAISAVPSDAILVTELCAELAERLGTEPVWEGHVTSDGLEVLTTLIAEQSRVVVVLHQRLWQHDVATSADAAILRQRIRQRPESVFVVLLDETPVPKWLANAQQFDLGAGGLHKAATFTLDAVASCGGTIGSMRDRAVGGGEAGSTPRWTSAPPSFLGQPRAHSTLRHELDALASSIESHLRERRTLRPEGVFELHALPFRLIARLDDVGLSFSWVAGRGPSVADGWLLVIEWSSIGPAARGVAALKAAKPVRQHSYRVEGGDPAHWRWRIDEPNGRAYSTANLLAEWLGGAGIASVAESRVSDYH